MFVGRDEILDRFTNTLTGNQGKRSVLFSQKRLGKLSIMYRLTERLNESDSVFCEKGRINPESPLL